MIRVVAPAIRAHFKDGRLLFLLTVFGVALGVGSVVSIQLINRSAVASFEAGVDAIYGDVDLTISALGPAFDDRLLPKVLASPDVAKGWPRLELLVRVAGGDGDPRPFLELKGVDLAIPAGLPIEEGFDTNVSPFSNRAFVAISRELATDLGRTIGDRLIVANGSDLVELTIGAFLDPTRTSSLASKRLAIMDIAAAQEAFGRVGELDVIDLELIDGVTREEAATRLSARLGPSVEVVTPGDQEQRARGLLEAFRVNLSALSLISLFVGIFLVYASVQASLLRRRREFGILRTLGATPRQVLTLIVIEVMAMGALGTLIGIPIGVHVARANLESVSTALTYVYLLKEVNELVVPAWLPILGAAIGIVGSILGALPPAIQLSRADPRDLLSSLSLHEGLQRTAGRLAAAGIVLLALALLAYALFGDGVKVTGFLLGAALMVAIPLVCPFALRSASRISIGKRLGVRYALRSLGRRLQTGAAAVASLAVASSMLFGVTTMVTSFRETVADWIDTTVRADVYVATSTWPRGLENAQLDLAIVDALANDPDVEKLDRLRKILTFAGQERLTLIGVDFTLEGGESRYPLLDGDVDVAFRRVLEEDAILLGEPVARRLGLWTGDSLVLQTREGATTLPIAGVYYDYSSATGNVALDIRHLDRLYGGEVVNTVGLFLKPGIDADRVVDRLRASYRGQPLTFTSNERIRTEALRIFDQTFLVTNILQIVSLAIAACGIALTLLVQARELVGETALYRALGAHRTQVFGLYVAKGAAIGIIGLSLGAIGGAALYWILSSVINRAYFGWTIQPSFPIVALSKQVCVISLAVVAASFYPAIVASRAPATELSREDA